ncbi:MAG: PKD domain-containing protein [Thermoplasmata archaeon]|nr:PKD domain-containing protein [Thermoplasmata archaeon]
MLFAILVTSPFLALVGTATAVPPLAPGASSPITPPGTSGLILTPTTGPVGSVVAASGTGYPANSTIAFSFDGQTVASNCTADESGSFPGTSGTPCDLTIPATPAGTDAVTAFAWSTSAINVGNEPYALAYDSGTSQVLVADEGDDNVTAIWDSNGSIAATIGVGVEPDGLAYDPDQGEVFVADHSSGNVTVVNETDDSVVDTIAVGAHPTGVAFDTAQDELFVANTRSDNVSVISGANNSVVTSIGVGDGPGSVTYDAGTDDVFVVNSGDDNVSVISAVTDRVVANVSVGDFPRFSAYDSRTGQVFVVNLGDDTASVISDTTDTVVATVPAGDFPYGITYDTGTGEMFVADQAADDVSIISDATNSVVSTLPVGSSPWAAVYDPGTGQVYVANIGSNNVSVISPSNGSSGPFTVISLASLVRGSGVSDTLVTVTGTGFAASSPINFTFGGSAVASSCSTDSTGTFPGISGTPCSLLVPVSAGGGHAILASDGTNQATVSYFVTNVSISQPSGTVGTAVAVSGIADTMNSGINLTFEGAAVPSMCSTDGTGAFPGTSGTPCMIAVPAASAGLHDLVAYGGWTNTTPIGVGPSPYGIVYDPGTGELFVADSQTSSVSVISEQTDLVVATIPVGNTPTGLAYDPGLGEIFVANEVDDTVSVISDTNDSVVATIPVGLDPLEAAYDPQNGEVFVTDLLQGAVSVISDSNNTDFATVPVGNGSQGIAYDPTTGQVFVVNDYTDNVSVIAGGNDTVVASINVADQPSSIAYDPDTREMFVGCRAPDQIDVLSDVSDTQVANVSVGSNPYSMTYDSSLHEVLVADEGSSTVTVISGANVTNLTTFGVGASPEGIAFDPAVGEAFVTSSQRSEVDVVFDPVEGTVPFTVLPSVALGASADIGQTVTVQGAGYGSLDSVPTFTLGTANLTCVNATVGTCAAGVVSTAQNGSFDSAIVIPSVPSDGSYNLTATDSQGNSATTMISVFFDPTLGSVSATALSIDLGQSTTFQVMAESGTGSYTYAWSGLPSGCNSTVLASVQCTPSLPGNFSVSVLVTDSNGATIAGGPLAVSVDSDVVAATPTASTGSGTVDAGQSVVFTTSASNGSGIYTSFTWTGLPTGCNGVTASVTCSGADLPAGQYSIAVSATDSNGFTSVPTIPINFAVIRDLTVTTPSASRPSGDLGQSVTFTTISSEGSGGAIFAWSGLPTGCSSVDSDLIQCELNTPGSFSVQVQATDSNQFSVTSAVLPFQVDIDPTATLTANRTMFDVGQTVTLSATGASGSGVYTYSWLGLPSGCSGATAVLNCTPPAAGNFSAEVKITDSDGMTADSPIVALVVAATLTGVIVASSGSPTVGQSVTLTASPSGGTGPLSIAWLFGDGSKGSGVSVNHTYSSGGSYVVTVWINDSRGESVEKTLDLSVGASNTLFGLGAGTAELVIVAAVVVVALAIVASVFLLRGRRQAPPSSPGSEESPSPNGPDEGNPTTDPAPNASDQ